MKRRSPAGNGASTNSEAHRSASLDRRMVAEYRRAAQRDRRDLDVDLLLVAIFGRLVPDDVVERIARRESRA